MDDSVYHVELRRDDTGIWATVTGPGLPPGGDTRASDNLWEVAMDVTTAIQDANPGFAAPYRLISG